jgi:hypothetical protein
MISSPSASSSRLLITAACLDPIREMTPTVRNRPPPPTRATAGSSTKRPDLLHDHLRFPRIELVTLAAAVLDVDVHQRRVEALRGVGTRKGIRGSGRRARRSG